MRKASVIVIVFICVFGAFKPIYAELEKLDIFEPNNSLDEARDIDLNKLIVVALFPENDRDYFKVNIKERGYLYVKYYELSKDLRLVFNFYGSTHKLIKGDCFDTTIEPGVYYIEMKDDYNRSDAVPFFISVNFSGEGDIFESNNSISQAKEINLGEVYEIVFMPKDDIDYFKIKVDRTGYLSFRLFGKTWGSDFYFGVYDINGKRLIEGDKEFCVTPGQYYVSLRSSSWASPQPLSFRVELLKLGDDILPPIHSKKEALPVQFGQSYKVAISTDEESWFKVQVDGPGKLLVLVSGAEKLQGNFSHTGLTFYIWNSKGKIIDRIEDDRTSTKRFSYLKESGEYFIEMRRIFMNTRDVVPFELYFDFLPDSKKDRYDLGDTPFNLYVIGFGIEETQNSRIEGELLAHRGKGKFVLAQDEEDLSKALTKISEEIKVQEKGYSSNRIKFWLILIFSFLVLLAVLILILRYLL